MFQVKICGITRVADALAAAEAGADAIGLNFYTGSDRYVAPAIARAISQATPRGVLRVGVFVKAAEHEVRSLVESTPLDGVQIHDDWPGRRAPQIAALFEVQAFRLAPGRFDEVTAELTVATRQGELPGAVLIDSHVHGQYGGTGVKAPWQELAGWRELWPAVPLVLAGGLTAENVAEAISIVRPAAVDVAGGVESSPGIKDAGRMRAFVENARAAFAALATH